MWIVCITSVRHVLTVNGYGGRQTKENEKSWCFKGWETLVNNISRKDNRANKSHNNGDKSKILLLPPLYLIFHQNQLAISEMNLIRTRRISSSV